MHARILSNNPLIYWFLIKGMIEEHLENTEKVRQNTERRCREEHAAIRHQSEEHAGQLAQLTAELERSQRKEMDLKKQLGDQKNISDRGMYCFDFGCGVFSRCVQRLSFEYNISCSSRGL